MILDVEDFIIDKYNFEVFLFGLDCLLFILVYYECFVGCDVVIYLCILMFDCCKW